MSLVSRLVYEGKMVSPLFLGGRNELKSTLNQQGKDCIQMQMLRQQARVRAI